MPRLPSTGLLSLAFLTATLPLTAGEKSLRAVIDTEVRAAWEREKITPAGKADDATFLRRVYLDLVGVIPSHDEAKQFLADPDPGKRAKLIDRLLTDTRYAANQAAVWDLLLFGRHPVGFEATSKRDGFKKWLTEKFAQDVPYDRWVRDLLLAQEEGPEVYHVQFRNRPEEATVAVTRTFLGTQLQCARCHDHPFERWTQKDFYGMAGFFVRTVVIDVAGDSKRKFAITEKSTGDVLFTGSVKEQRPGQKGEPVKPRFLGSVEDLKEPDVPKGFKEPDFKGKGAPPKPLFSRKEKLVEWLKSPDNPYFARAAANRVWAQYMGRGLVHPVDDLTEENRASHPALLDALTKELVDHKFDLKHLIRELVSSETYQLADTGPVREVLPQWFERARVRPLSAEELMASFRVATGDPGKQGGDFTEYMVRYFGEPTNGRGDFQGSLAEHLFLNNAEHLRRMIGPQKGNLADVLLTSKEPWEVKVDRLFLSVLSRPPRAGERQRFVEHLTSNAKETSALTQEAIWVLLSCSEFRFNR